MSEATKLQPPANRAKVGLKIIHRIESLVAEVKAADLKATVIALELVVFAVERDVKRAERKKARR